MPKTYKTVLMDFLLGSWQSKCCGEQDMTKNVARPDIKMYRYKKPSQEESTKKMLDLKETIKAEICGEDFAFSH